MRQGIFRAALLVLALLVPLSRLSFADDTFPVSVSLNDSGDVETVSVAFNSFSWQGFSQATWGGFHNSPTVGEFYGGVVDSQVFKYQPWSYDGYSGSDIYSYSNGDFAASGGCTMTPSGCEALATWHGDLYLDNNGITLFEIAMSGTGTVDFTGQYEGPDLNAVSLIYGTADLTGVGQVVYEDPSVAEPSTLTLMGIAVVASIVVIRFRRTAAAQN